MKISIRSVFTTQRYFFFQLLSNDNNSKLNESIKKQFHFNVMLRSNWWQNYSSEMKKKSILSIVIHGNWIKCNHLTILFIQFCLILKMQQEWKKIIFISFHFDFDPDRISHDWLNLTICYNRFKKGWMKNAFAWQVFFSLLTLRFIAFYHEAKVLMPSLLRLYKSSMPDIESASNLRKKGIVDTVVIFVG